MAGASSKSTFRLGMTDCLPFLIVVGPFAFLFGVVSTEAGLDVLQTFSFSFIVVAGAAQLTALSMLQDHAPLYMAIIGALAVNLRTAMYSASLTPWLSEARLWQRALAAYCLVDQPYAVSLARYEQNPGWNIEQRLSYYFGAAAAIVPFWFAMSVVGALIGKAIPDWLALDFAMPITFIALVAPMLRTLAHLAAALVSVVAALLLAWLPAGTGLLAAAALAMIAGAQVEMWMLRRQAAG